MLKAAAAITLFPSVGTAEEAPKRTYLQELNYRLAAMVKGDPDSRKEERTTVPGVESHSLEFHKTLKRNGLLYKVRYADLSPGRGLPDGKIGEGDIIEIFITHPPKSDGKIRSNGSAFFLNLGLDNPRSALTLSMDYEGEDHEKWFAYHGLGGEEKYDELTEFWNADFKYNSRTLRHPLKEKALKHEAKKRAEKIVTNCLIGE